MKFFNQIKVSLVVLFALSFVSFAQAGVGGTAQSVAINASVNESLTLALTGGPIVLPLNGSVSNTVTAAVTYNVTASNHTSGLVSSAWLGSATAALSGPQNIPSSAIGLTFSWSGSLQGSGSACTLAADPATGSVAGATCVRGMTELTQAQLTTTPQGSFNDTYALSYTAGNGSSLKPGSYTGTFFVNYLIP